MSQTTDELRDVPVAWEALEDAFENNAPEVHSYLNVESGDVIRVVDGVADPAMHARIAQDPTYMLVDPVSSREQYRWMERYIATIEDPAFRQRLVSAIDGKGAFRRFKDVLMNHPVDRERWFAFRSERLRTAMEGWLSAHGLSPVERQKWEVPTPETIKAQMRRSRDTQPVAPDDTAGVRTQLREIIATLPPAELALAAEFLQFLQAKSEMGEGESEGASEGDGSGDDGDDA